MSGFTPINQTKLDRMDAGNGASALQLNCSSPPSGGKRKRTRALGSTSARKKAGEVSKANPAARSRETKNPTNDISQRLKVSKPIPRSTVKSSQEIGVPSSEIIMGKNIPDMESDATSMHENNLRPLLPLTSTTVPSDGGTDQGRKLEGMIDTAPIETSEMPLYLKSSVLSSPKPENIITESDKVFPSHLIQLPHSNFLTFEGAQDDIATNVNNLNEVNEDNEYSKNVSQFPGGYQADLAITYEDLTEGSSSRHSELCSPPLVRYKYLRYNTDSALHEDPDLWLLGEAPVLGHPLRKSDDDDFPMDDEGIEDMMGLTEIRQGKGRSSPNLNFPGSPCVTHDDNYCPDGLPCPDKHVPYNGGEALQSTAMNRLNATSSSSIISKSPTSTGLSSADYFACSEPNDAGSLKTCDENFFDDDDLDLDLVEMRSPLCNSELSFSSHLPQKPIKSMTKKPQPLANRVRNKSTAITQPSPSHPDVPHHISFDAFNNPIPFIRPPFPASIRDRSPIHGLSPRMVLRTCFRIGEALNAATVSLRSPSSSDAIIELYCRVLTSSRSPSTFKQTFQFADVFSTPSPVLTGTYGVWRGIGLWDHDARVFLGEEGQGKMARVVGKIKREGEKGWEMRIMSVWEVDWEDVGIAKGIVLA